MSTDISPPYTPQQVIHNLQNFLEQLRDFSPNLTSGPGWVRHQCESILARGIEGDSRHRPAASGTHYDLLS
jgi:hypothetical protein